MFCFWKLVLNSQNHFGIYKSILRGRIFGHEPKSASNQEKSASAALIKNRERKWSPKKQDWRYFYSIILIWHPPSKLVENGLWIGTWKFPNWHELWKQEKGIIFYKTQWAWQSVKLTQLMSIFSFKIFLMKIQLTKLNPRRTRG